APQPLAPQLSRIGIPPLKFQGGNVEVDYMTAAIAPSLSAAQPVALPALLNLLIVEEDRIVREACREVASGLGYRATSAESSEQALRMLDGQNIDLVLLDLKLQGLSGVEVLREFKARRPDVEVVVLTSNGSVETAVEAM